MGLVFSTLPSYLNSLDYTVIQVSIVFLMMNLLAVIGEPIFGYFSDKFNPLYTGLGLSIGTVVSSSFLGPLPFLHLKPSYSVIMVAAMIFGRLPQLI